MQQLADLINLAFTKKQTLERFLDNGGIDFNFVENLVNEIKAIRQMIIDHEENQ